MAGGGYDQSTGGKRRSSLPQGAYIPAGTIAHQIQRPSASDHPHKSLKIKTKRGTHANIGILIPLNRLRRKLRILRIDHRLLDPRSPRRGSFDRQLHLTHLLQRSEQEHGLVDGFTDGDQPVVLENTGLELRPECFGDVGTFFGSEDDPTEVVVDACESAASSFRWSGGRVRDREDEFGVGGERTWLRCGM